MIDAGGGGRLACALCGRAASRAALDEAGWMPPNARARMASEHPEWQLEDGACPACVQEILLTLLYERGDDALHEEIQAAWPLDPKAAFGALPTPLRMHADPRVSGYGATLALVDAAFHPHPDLAGPPNRIAAWADAGRDPVEARFFAPDETPAWPGSDAAAPMQWHGLMTSAVAAGDGRLSHGLYRGMAPQARVVLVQAREPGGRISHASITRALEWLGSVRERLGLRIVSLSVAGDEGPPRPDDPVDAAVASLVEDGVVVIAAAGNDGERRLIAPATAPRAITVGGLDDHNTFDHEAVTLWHGNYGDTVSGAAKPELVAPSLWVVAPLLPGTAKAARARALFSERAAAAAEDPEIEERLRRENFVTPHYHLVDGTSVAAPLVAGVAAGMLQANPDLTPAGILRALLAACRPVKGAEPERQGAGALDAGLAVARARRERRGAQRDRPPSPIVEGRIVRFVLHDHDARDVRVCGTWDGWARPVRARLIEPGLFEARLEDPGPGRHQYKYLVDETRWIDDPDNPRRVPDGYGRQNSVLELPEA